MYAHMERVWYQCDKNLPTIEQKLFLRVLMTFVFFFSGISLQIQDLLLKMYPDRLCRSERKHRQLKTLCQRLPAGAWWAFFGPFHSFISQ